MQNIRIRRKNKENALFSRKYGTMIRRKGTKTIRCRRLYSILIFSWDSETPCNCWHRNTPHRTFICYRFPGKFAQMCNYYTCENIRYPRGEWIRLSSQRSHTREQVAAKAEEINLPIHQYIGYKHKDEPGTYIYTRT